MIFRIMKTRIVFFIILFFATIFANAFSEIRIEENPDGVNVFITNLKYETKKDSGNLDRILIPQLQKFSNYKNIIFDDYTLNFAIPKSGAKIEFKILSQKNIYNNIDSKYFSDDFIIKSQKIEKTRGVDILPITIFPFKIDVKSKQISFIENLVIKIKFNNENIKLTEFKNNFESAFFAQILNKKHLIDLFSKRQIQQTKDKFLAKDWYDPNIDYVKIETEKDGVVGANIKDLAEYLPLIINKSSKYLHLIHNGKPYPFFITNDDGIISANDRILFYGLHPAGDSTYWDNYASTEPFFIYYDETSEGLRYEKMDDLNSDNLQISQSVDIFEHIEKEVFYAIGTEFVSDYYDGTIEKSNYNDTRTVLSEGWFWDQIVPYGFNNIYTKDFFRTNINLYPSDNINDKLNVSLRYLTNQDSISRKPLLQVATYFDLYFSVNSLFQKRDSLQKYHKRDFISSGNQNLFLPGLNQISVESKRVYIETEERTNIDFIEISGKSKPIAYKNQLNFIGKNSDMRINSSGFTSNNLTIFDMVNYKYKEVSSTKKGFQFVMGGISGDKPSVSVGISDSLNYSNQNGIYIQTYSTLTKSYIYKLFPEANNDFNSYINSLVAGTPVAIVMNSKSSNNDYSSIRSLGSKIIDNLKSGQVYCGAFIKSDNKFEEKIGDNYSTLTSFIENSNGLNYTYDIAIKSNDLSKFIIVGNDSLYNVSKISKVNKTNLAQSNGKIDAVFISHKNFIQKAKQLADYRMKTQNVIVEVVDVDDIYKELNFGKKSPHSIKELLNKWYLERNLTKSLLIGDASWDARKILPNSISTDWVPTFGYPASDWWYTYYDGEFDIKPDIVIGRISVNNETQFQNYIDKAIEYDTLNPQPWMKNILFLIGGYDSNQIRQFNGLILDYYRDEIIYPNFCGKIDKVVKDLSGASTSTQGGEIRSKINQGALWTIYIGHAAAEIFDMDGWNVNSLNNKGRYGILTTVSCNTGAFAEPQLIASRNEQYILEKDKGYVAATGSTFTGFVFEHNNIATRMIEAIGDKSLNMRYIGDLLLYGKSNFTIESMAQMITGNTYSLLGDPLLKVKVGTESDAYISENNVKIANQDGSNRFVVDDDFANIDGTIYNYGYSISENIPVRIVRDYENQSDTLTTNISGLCYSADFSSQFAIKDMPGRHKFTINIDPENSIPELDKNNNILVRSIDVFQEGLLNFDPLAYWDIKSTNPVFRVINPFDNENNFGYQFIIGKSEDTTNIMYSADSQIDDEFININENYVDWKPVITLSEGSYWFHSRYINLSNSNWSRWQSIPINVKNEFDQSKVQASIQSIPEFTTGKFNKLMFNSENGKNQIYLRRDTLSYRSLSVKGNNPGNPEGNPVVAPHVNIEVGGQVFFDGGHDLGFNIVTIKNLNGKIISRQKRFETWGLDLPYPAEEHFRDSLSPQHLVEFIRDSVQDDEYLFLATCKSSFRLLEFYKFYGDPGDHGTVDTLLYYLKQFGSKIADTLKIDSVNAGGQISFTMMGWRGAEIGSIPESISYIGDTALIQGKLLTFDDYGSYHSKSIGRAKKWNSVNIESNYPQNGTKVSLILKGLNSKTNIIDTIANIDFPRNIDLSNVDGKIYQELSAFIEFQQTEYSNKSLINQTGSTISSIKFDFIPADEIAISKKLTKLDREPSLRGYPVNLASEIQNLSLRNKVDSVLVRLNISRGGTDNDYKNIWIKDFEPNEKFDIWTPIQTDFLDYDNKLVLNIDPAELKTEFFRFNNDYQIDLITIKDTIKPTGVIKIDGYYHQYNDYISILPIFEVELFDNSPLQITDSTKITVRVNGFLHPYQRTLWSKFETINDGTNLKARFSFKPDSIQYEDVSIIIYLADNEGNRDTITTFARTSLLNAMVDDIITYPNPSVENVNFKFNYKAPLPGGKAYIEIYDLSGNKIDEISQELTLRNNVINWIGKYNGYLSLPVGVYFYRIKFETDYYVEPVYGKFVKIN